MKNIDPCKPFACKIQDCLRRNEFQEPSCQAVIEHLKECCRKWGETSLVCDGFKNILAEEEKSKQTTVTRKQ